MLGPGSPSSSSASGGTGARSWLNAAGLRSGRVRAVVAADPAGRGVAAPVDVQDGARDEARQLARQEQDGAGAVVDLTPAQGHLGAVRLACALRRRLGQTLVAGGRDGIGCDDV